jgi:hypothetical protein
MYYIEDVDGMPLALATTLDDGTPLKAVEPWWAASRRMFELDWPEEGSASSTALNAVSYHCRMVEQGMHGYVPSGWPDAVSPPGSEDWEASAAVWLLDLIPEYRMYPSIRRYPVVLAFIARHVLQGAVEGARDGYRTIRSQLGEMVPPHVIDAALRDFRTEGRRMAATVRTVDLVERALRGE